MIPAWHAMWWYGLLFVERISHQAHYSILISHSVRFNTQIFHFGWRWGLKDGGKLFAGQHVSANLQIPKLKKTSSTLCHPKFPRLRWFQQFYIQFSAYQVGAEKQWGCFPKGCQNFRINFSCCFLASENRCFLHQLCNTWYQFSRRCICSLGSLAKAQLRPTLNSSKNFLQKKSRKENCIGLIFIKKNEHFLPQFDPLESLLAIDPTHGWRRIGTPSCALGGDEEHTLPGNEPISHWWLHTQFDSIRKKPSHVKSFFAEAQSGTVSTWRKVCLTITQCFSPWCGTCRWQSSIQPSYWHQKKTWNIVQMNDSKTIWEWNGKIWGFFHLGSQHSHLAVHNRAILWHHIHTITALLRRARGCLGLQCDINQWGQQLAFWGPIG